MKTKEEYRKEIEELLEGVEADELLEKANCSKKESDDSDEEDDDSEDGDEEDEEDDEEMDENLKIAKKQAGQALKNVTKSAKGVVKKYKAKKLTKEDIDTAIEVLLESESNLTEGFKENASLIFTTALASRTAEVRQQLEEEAQKQLEEAIEENLNTVCKKVNNYITFALNEWAKENEVAIESNLQAQVAEEFLSNVHAAFIESYIEVPEDRRNAFVEIEQENEDLTRKLQEAREEMETLKEEKTIHTRLSVIEEASKDMSETDKERLAELLEEVEFKSPEVFAKKVNIVVETYFRDIVEDKTPAVTDKSKRTVIVEGSNEEVINEDVEVIDPRIARHLAHLNKIKG